MQRRRNANQDGFFQHFPVNANVPGNYADARIAAQGQLRAVQQGYDEVSDARNETALWWLVQNKQNEENQLKNLLNEYVKSNPVGVWCSSIMGIGPVAATRKVMEKTGYQIGDFDLIEANEAFAAQSVAVGQDLGFDMDKLNVNGGAIALGHPVGCSGTRILVTLLYEMQKRNAQKGLATLCVGGGMGAAAIVEKY